MICSSGDPITLSGIRSHHPARAGARWLGIGRGVRGDVAAVTLLLLGALIAHRRAADSGKEMAPALLALAITIAYRRPPGPRPARRGDTRVALPIPGSPLVFTHHSSAVYRRRGLALARRSRRPKVPARPAEAGKSHDQRLAARSGGAAGEIVLIPGKRDQLRSYSGRKALVSADGAALC